MAIFGNNVDGASTADSATLMAACRFVLGENASVTSITAMIAHVDGVNRDWEALIYSDVAGVPTALLGTTNIVSVASGVWAWVTFNFGAAVLIPAGTYWLASWGNVANNLSHYDAGVANQWVYDSTVVWNVPNDPFVPDAASWLARSTSIYATYDPVSNMRRLMMNVGL